VSGDDTDIGGRRAAFPETPASAVLAARSDDPVARARGFSSLVTAYWKPVYKCIRIRFRKNNEEAKDLTQSFFTHALEREIFRSYDPQRASFRAFVRTCLSNYVRTADEAARRIKRGGRAIKLSLDFDAAENEVLAAKASPAASFEEEFDREMARALESSAVDELKERLESRGKALYFRIFSRYDLADEDEPRPTYKDLAEELGIKTTDVTNHLASARRQLRTIVLRRLREITASEEEYRSEAQSLLGIDPEAA
jgi:RNA polymerase sigma factor (sigma-70 family)